MVIKLNPLPPKKNKKKRDRTKLRMRKTTTTIALDKLYIFRHSFM
jgi:hypothetical protein